MPRFLVERNFGLVSDEAILEGVARSRRLMNEHFPDLEWEHTHVCHTDDGDIKAFCVYVAPSAERLSEHTSPMVGPSAQRIYEIVGVINPAEIVV